MLNIPNKKLLSEADISFEEFMILFSLQSYRDITKSLVEKSLIQLVDKKYILTENGNNIYNSIVEKCSERDDSDIENLIIEMRALFPKGTKTGSTMWRGNIRLLCKKIQKFFILYGNYTDEEILDATKRYVDSYANDRTYMRTLSNFIMKDETRRGGEENSDLANFLENTDGNTNSNNNWMDEVR